MASAAAVFIADAQAHIWQRVRPGAEALAHRAEPFGADEMLRRMDEAGVQRAILVPTSWSDDNGNELALEAAKAHPDRFAVFGVLPLAAADGPAQLARWKATPGLLGIRASFHTDALAPLLTDGTADWFWPAAERAGVPIMVYAPNQLAEVGRIAARHPDLRLIVDHLGQPRVTPDINHAEHVAALIRLAHLPNVAVKASAMPQYSQQPYPFKDMHGHVCRALEAFGPSRVFWGSDLTRLEGVSYVQAVTMFTEELACLGPDDRELVMGRALCEWIGWRL
ncbi:MAG TPA: amidohydrolase family protein [Chloroflexota bacterium]|nr:amidohydrolase family protein [Chloroflexota bacterium]